MLIFLQADAPGAHDDQIGIHLIGHIADDKGRLALSLKHIAGNPCLLKAGPGLLQQLGNLDRIVHGALLRLHH